MPYAGYCRTFSASKRLRVSFSKKAIALASQRGRFERFILNMTIQLCLIAMGLATTVGGLQYVLNWFGLAFSPASKFDNEPYSIVNPIR